MLVSDFLGSRTSLVRKTIFYPPESVTHIGARVRLVVVLVSLSRFNEIVLKIKVHSTGEIQDYVEARLCNLCVFPIF